MNSSAVPPGAPVGRTAVILRQISQTQPLTLVCSVLPALSQPTADPGPVMDTSMWLQALLGPVGFHTVGHLVPTGCVFLSGHPGPVGWYMLQTAPCCFLFQMFSSLCISGRKSVLTTVNYANTVLWQHETKHLDALQHKIWVTFCSYCFSSRYYGISLALFISHIYKSIYHTVAHLPGTKLEQMIILKSEKAYRGPLTNALTDIDDYHFYGS